VLLNPQQFYYWLGKTKPKGSITGEAAFFPLDQDLCIAREALSEIKFRRQSRIYFANALRTTRSTCQRWIGLSQDDDKINRQRRKNYSDIAVERLDWRE
jgi:hypothetical protein